MSEEKINISPLEGWTKEQIKSALKAHTKTELLKIAMQWRYVAESLMSKNKEETTEDKE